MKKYSSKEEIDKAYRQKLWRLKQWYTITTRAWDAWLNHKNKIKDTSKEDMRQECMRLAQENCKLREVINTWSEMIECCSCGNKYHYKDMHGWHYETRANKRVCIHPLNINPQCRRCNNPLTKPKDEQEKIRVYLLCRYTTKEVLELEKLRKIKWSYSVPKDHWHQQHQELEKINEKLKQRIREMF